MNLEKWIEEKSCRVYSIDDDDLMEPAQPFDAISADLVRELFKGKALLPIEPNMTTEMKAAHMGEYFVTIEIDCPDECEADEECGHCEGTGICDQKIAIHWTTCKRIFRAMYATAVEQAHSPTTSAGDQGDV